MTIAAQELLPAVRRAGGDTLIVADGFSCRQQILHGAGRHALHPVEVLEWALRKEFSNTGPRDRSSLPNAGSSGSTRRYPRCACWHRRTAVLARPRSSGAGASHALNAR